MQDEDGIRIVVIQGSIRPGNYTSKAVGLVMDELEGHPKVASADLVDPASYDLAPPGTGVSAPLQELVSRATGLVLATPEYHGGFSSVLKLVIENLGFPSVLSGKPVALLGVAAGQIGAIKSLEQLRGVCSHVGAIVLPGPVSVANVQSVFRADGTCTDPKVEKRVRGVATSLVDYIGHAVCPRITLEAMAREG